MVVERVLIVWGHHLKMKSLVGINADGKMLRGSCRDDARGLHLVTIVQHDLGVVLGQARVSQVMRTKAGRTSG